mmetsp:Transcript_112494/g.350598  ORF Transcript_112494/g.350598 Transcript_112494/m.350598 type:complete len:399 (+) Transcript_112494:242-1438(+)
MLEEVADLPAAVPQHGLRGLRVLGGGGGPRRLPSQELVAQEDGRRREVRGRVLKHPVLRERELQQVLRQLAVGVGAPVHGLVPLQEVHGRWRAELELHGRQDGDLHAHDLLPRVGLVGDVDKVVDLRRVQLLELCGHEERRDAGELQVLAEGVPPLEKAVQDADGEEERLRPELVLLVHVHEPVHQDGAHPGGHLRLPLHVAGLGEVLPLPLLQLRVDVGGVLGHVLRVLRMRRVHVDILVRRRRQPRGQRRRGLARGLGRLGLGAADRLAQWWSLALQGWPGVRREVRDVGDVAEDRRPLAPLRGERPRRGRGPSVLGAARQHQGVHVRAGSAWACVSCQRGSCCRLASVAGAGADAGLALQPVPGRADHPQHALAEELAVRQRLLLLLHGHGCGSA